MLNKKKFHLRRVFRKSKNILFLTIFILSISSCEEEIGQFGSDILPDSDFVSLEVDSTTNITFKPVAIDSIRTDMTTTAVLGSMADPVFGLTTAHFATQLNLTQSTLFKSDVSIESVTLRLLYADHEGDLSDQQEIKVHELVLDESSTGLKASKAYYSNTDIRNLYSGINLLETFQLSFEEKIRIYDTIKSVNSVTKDTTDVIRKVLDLQLPVAFGERLKAIPDSVYKDGDIIEFMKLAGGIYIETASTRANGAMVNFNLKGSVTGIHVDFITAAEQDSAVPLVMRQYYGFSPTRYQVGYNSYVQTTNVNIFAHNFKESGSTILDFGTESDKLYFKSLGGIKTKLEFPDLEEWFNREYKMISDVELIITPDTLNAYFESYGLPASLWIRQLDENGNEIVVDKIASAYGREAIGGDLDATKNQYVFHLPLHFTEILKNNVGNHGFVLFYDEPGYFEHKFSNYESSVIVPDPNNPVQLKITYITD